MSLAKFCKCGHIKSDHATKNTKRKLREGPCEWLDCKCKGFKLKELKSTAYGAEPLEPMIEYDESYKVSPLFIEKPNHKLLISDCDKNGIAKPINDKRSFNRRTWSRA